MAISSGAALGCPASSCPAVFVSYPVRDSRSIKSATRSLLRSRLPSYSVPPTPIAEPAFVFSTPASALGAGALNAA